MTIALSLKVNDGIVLASDSASSIFARTPEGQSVGVVNVYSTADKVFNLCKGLPIGAITWGSGSIGMASISTLVKDFRRQLTNDIARDRYTIEEIAEELSDFIYNQHYTPSFGEWQRKPDIGFMIVGYSAGEDYSEEWIINITNGDLDGPNIIRGEEQVGLTWNGEPEAISRLYFGIGGGLGPALLDMGHDQEVVNNIHEGLRERLRIPLITPAMPIQDAIDLAEFLVDTTIKFSRFKPGAPTVGGPVDVAAITKHEGFKWVYRKHYYDVSLNPIIPGGIIND